jgi:excisionase family DNA binding protein
VTGQLLTARVVAQRLGLCTETVLAWVRDGRLPAFRLGRAIRIPEDQLDAWLQAQATSARGAVTVAGSRARGTLRDASNPEHEE